MIHRLLIAYAFLLPYDGLWWELYDSQSAWKPFRIVGALVLVIAFIMGKRRYLFDLADKTFLFLITLGISLAFLWHVFAGPVRMDWAVSDTLVIFFGFSVCVALKVQSPTWQHAEQLLMAYALGTVSSVLFFEILPGTFIGGRLDGLYENPNRLAVSAAAAVNILLARVLFERARDTLRLVFYVGMIVLLLLTLLLTGSRGSIVGLIVSAAFFVIPLRASGRASRRTLQRIMFLGVPAAFAAAIVLSQAFARYEDESIALQRYRVEIASNGASGRYDIWRSAVNVAFDHYLVGTGTAQYRYYHKDSVAELVNIYQPKMLDSDLDTHNDYLSLLVTTGLIGLLVYFRLLASISVRLTARIRAVGEQMSWSLAACPSLFVMLLIGGMTHGMFINPEYYFIMAIVSLAALVRPPRIVRAPLVSRLRREAKSLPHA